MKKFGIFLLLACLFAGCGEKEKKGSEAINPKASKEKVKLIYARGEEASATDQIIELFTKKYPYIEVELMEMSGTTDDKHDKYLTMFAMEKNSFDVFNGDVVWLAEFAESGYVMSLENYMTEEDWKNYTKGAVDAVTYNGKTWGIMEHVDSGLLFYRKDIVKTPPGNWEELLEMSKKYKAETGIKNGFVFQAKHYEGLVCNALEYIRSYGGDVFDENGKVIINSPETINGLKMLLKIVNSDIVPKDITKYTENESGSDFINGDAIFHRNWPYIWNLIKNSDLKDKVGEAALPVGDAKLSPTIGGWIGMINGNTEHPEEAWLFLQFMAGPEGQRLRAIYGGTAPSYEPILEEKNVLKENPYFEEEEFKKSVKAGISRPKSPIYPEISDILQQEISMILANEKSVEEAVAAMEMRIKEAIGD